MCIPVLSSMLAASTVATVRAAVLVNRIVAKTVAQAAADAVPYAVETEAVAPPASAAALAAVTLAVHSSTATAAAALLGASVATGSTAAAIPAAALARAVSSISPHWKCLFLPANRIQQMRRMRPRTHIHMTAPRKKPVIDVTTAPPAPTITSSSSACTIPQHGRVKPEKLLVRIAPVVPIPFVGFPRSVPCLAPATCRATRNAPQTQALLRQPIA